MKYATIYYNGNPLQKFYFTKYSIEKECIIFFDQLVTAAIVPNNYLIIFSDER
jgi:hypothetical protein